MARCEHGFRLEAVPCPNGCHDDRLLVALRSSQSLREAADSLNWGRVGQFNQRARANAEIQAAVARLRKTMFHKGGSHPGFVDMTGEVKGPWTVLKRLPNSSGNAVWLCQHTCGATQSIEGIALRSSTPTCKTCKRRGRS